MFIKCDNIYTYFLNINDVYYSQKIFTVLKYNYVTM